MYRIMLADDEPIVTKAMMTLTDWKALDCEVIHAAYDGQEVLSLLESLTPDVLITDIRMPGADGIEIAKYIKEQGLNIKVIVLTAYADFSYAQSALKYDVVDYITKTGAFEGLEDAVEKAKSQLILEKRGKQSPLLLQNFYKSIFDGTLYLSKEMIEQTAVNGSTLGYFRVLLFRYRSEQDNRERMSKTTKSLLNFFSMVFTGCLHICVPINGNTIAVVLSKEMELTEEEISIKCREAVEMMDNFMGLNVYIGISNSHEDALELKESYEEAKAMFESNFLDDTSKISFYGHIHQEKNGYHPTVEKMGEDVIQKIRKGLAKEAEEAFLDMIKEQIHWDYSANAMKGSGIVIQNECRRLLLEQEKNLYDITGRKPSITGAIYSCCYLKDYKELLLEIITKTAECLSESKSHKNRLILACQDYINAHYHENLFVSEIADALGVNVSYLSRSFKDATGETIIATMNRKKMEQALFYLDNTDMKVYEVADALGFENVTYFSHFFKKYMGMAPKEYAMNHERH